VESKRHAHWRQKILRGRRKDAWTLGCLARWRRSEDAPLGGGRCRLGCLVGVIDLDIVADRLQERRRLVHGGKWEPLRSSAPHRSRCTDALILIVDHSAVEASLLA
jgi:hypothetical protein